MKNLKSYFRMAKNITYLDSAALGLKPNAAIKANNDFYNKYSVSVRTSNAPLGIKNIKIISDLREKIAKLLDTNIEKTSIIFTSGATQSLNNFALMFADKIKGNDEILISAYNHSSNFIPWIELAKKVGAKVVVKENLEGYINEKTKVVALSQITNNFSVRYDLEKIYQKAKEVGAILVNDAAQAIVYEKVSMNNCDVVAFSANKFYGPTGLGVLAVNNEVLSKLNPVNFGGGSVLNIDRENNWIKIPSIDLFEPGTANFAGIYMFNAAIDFFNTHIGYENTGKILNDISNYAHKELKKINNIQVYSQPSDHIILFNIDGVDSHDIAHYLGQNNIYVRSGLFCAHYVRNVKESNSYVRVSLGVYNTKSDVRKLVDALKKGGDFIVI
ncbi:aminotransferase class V-fold PLP-dependent enzyme [Mycoplasma sp. HS2188]|uniref:aminotransferase class V-fold PLP-dependent enzyme n=1 Tax=Mycoplasma sp. HS2188 TaxID=2976765 RepID=UPI0021A9A25E|nr:aminotransferase class V-fold PLP-dependent enzyme [Mycoplasma sp. HS2188]MCT4469655.1 aminotransferase class V-fold PLP-dependent enzyme [Mycoplasma sp. HS2188]